MAVGGTVDDVAYGADVELTVSVPAEQVESLQKRLTELSAGGITAEELGRDFRPGPRQEV